MKGNPRKSFHIVSTTTTSSIDFMYISKALFHFVNSKNCSQKSNGELLSPLSTLTERMLKRLPTFVFALLKQKGEGGVSPELLTCH